MKILNFGSCNIDYVYSLDHIVEPGETETTYKMETFSGGKGLNQSVALAKAGAEVYHAGCIGEDGEMLRQVLVESKVNTDYLKEVSGKNGHAIIQVTKQGENSIFLYPGSNEMVTKDYIGLVLADFNEGDIILLQNEISNVDYIIQRAYEKKMCIILNPSPFNEKMSEIDFNMISYIILNEVEANGISGLDSWEESLVFIRKKYPDLKVMLTIGSKGCVYSDKTFECRQSAFKVEVADTTAAGDTFTGYFVSELSKGTDYKKILKIASAASAIAVSRKGAAPSIPERSEVLDAIDKFDEIKLADKSVTIKKQIDSYMEKNVRTANLEELAKSIGYSAVYTGNLVKKITGETFSKLLQKKRCKIASKLLLETDMSVKEIIESVGYENESFFRKVFKEKYGANPLDYRKKGITL